MRSRIMDRLAADSKGDRVESDRQARAPAVRDETCYHRTEDERETVTPLQWAGRDAF